MYEEIDFNLDSLPKNDLTGYKKTHFWPTCSKSLKNSRFSKPYKMLKSDFDNSVKFPIDDLPLKCITKESLTLNPIILPRDLLHPVGSESSIPIKKIMESKLSFNSNPDIEFEHLTSNKINKYKRMKEHKNIIGFIVNVHDATNFDIDLDISPEQHKAYQDVISNEYSYQDLDPDFIENPDFSKITIFKPLVGKTYRCRLKGIGINQFPTTSNHLWKSNQLCVEIKQLIDRTDGWVICDISDIDVYQRLLVDVSIVTSTETINLRSYLLSKMINDPNPIFYPYSSKRYRHKIPKRDHKTRYFK